MLRTSRLLTITAASASALVLAAGPAFAATTYNASATDPDGNPLSGTIDFHAPAAGSAPQLRFTTSNGQRIRCASGSIDGSLKLGPSLPGKGVGSITDSTWTSCIGPAGVRLSLEQEGTWLINAAGKTTSGGATPGTVSGFGLHAADVNTGGSQCSFDVAGTLRSVLATPSSGPSLTVRPSSGALVFTDVTGCSGLIRANDTGTLGGGFGPVEYCPTCPHPGPAWKVYHFINNPN